MWTWNENEQTGRRADGRGWCRGNIDMEDVTRGEYTEEEKDGVTWRRAIWRSWGRCGEREDVRGKEGKGTRVKGES